MNLRPQRPERCALPGCATPRGWITGGFRPLAETVQRCRHVDSIRMIARTTTGTYRLLSSTPRRRPRRAILGWAAAAPAAGGGSDMMAQLQQLETMQAAGVLTPEQYEAAKNKLLGV